MPGPDKTLEAPDLLGDLASQLKINPKSSIETSQHPSIVNSYQFDPSNPYYEYIDNPTPFTTDVDAISAEKQGRMTAIGRGLKQMGANLLAGLGQSLLSTIDVVDGGTTVKSLFNGGKDDFNSSFMGVSSKDMLDWSSKVARNNQIFEANPGEVSLGSASWWAKEMLPQAGTLIGNAVGAIATTVGIEAATDGVGTEYAIANLAKNLKGLWGATEMSEVVKGGIDLAKGMKGSAAMYATISRYSEARFEAQNNYKNTYDKLSESKKPDGTLYTEEEKQQIASEGAKVDFGLTLAQLPLDILAMRLMVFNPVAGTAEGGLERALEKLAGVYGKSKVGKTAGWLTTHGLGSAIEGLESGAIPIFQREGEHHAMILAGLEKDDSSLGDRLSEDIQSTEFKNMVASGVLGSLAIGPLMNKAQSIITGNRQAKFNDFYQDYIKNVAPVNDSMSQVIRALDAKGDKQSAFSARRQYSSSEALTRLHLDAQANKSDAYNAWINHLESTLSQVNSGNYDNIQDLYGEVHPEQTEQIKNEFGTYLSDAKEMKSIYDNVKYNYNKNFVPLIAQTHFNINRLTEAGNKINTSIAEMQAKLPQFNQLSPNGQNQYNAQYELSSLMSEKDRLTDQSKDTQDAHERQNIDALIQINKDKITQVKNNLDTISKDELYSPEQRNIDKDILNSALRDKNYAQAMRDREFVSNAISLQRKNLALWNNPEYVKSKTDQSIANARTQSQVNNNVESPDEKTNEDSKEAIDRRNKESIAKGEALTMDNAPITNSPPVPTATSEALHTSPTQSTENLQPVNPTANNSVSPKVTTGNADLFDSSFDELSQVDLSIDPATGKPFHILLSPATVNENKLQGTDRDKVKNAVSNILEDIGGTPSFEDLVKYFISRKDKSTADQYFNLLKAGWQLNGKPEEDFNKIYNKLFSDPITDLIEVGPRVFETEIETADTTAIESNEKEEESNAAENVGITNVDTNGQVTYTYTSLVTNNEKPKMAILGRLHETVRTVMPDGSIKVSHNYTSDELNQGQYVNSWPLYHPDKFLPGTELEVRVPHNFMEIMIPVYSVDGAEKKAITFGEYVTQNKLTPDMQEYQDKIPMIHYRKGANADEVGLAFVHDVSWYNPTNFLQTEPEKMQQAIDSTREIRKEVLNKAIGEGVSVTITDKKNTTFDMFKTPNKGIEGAPKYDFIPFTEASPESKFSLATSATNLQNIAEFNNNDSVLLRNSPFKPGYVYDIRRAGWKEGKKSFYAQEVSPRPITTEVKTTVLKALNIFLSKNNTNTAIRQQHDKTAKEIQHLTGLDIKSGQGIRDYLRQFINVHGIATDPFADAADYNTINAIANSTIKGDKEKNLGYLVIQNSGSVYAGATNLYIAPKLQTTFSNSNKFDTAKVSQFLANLTKLYIPKVGNNGERYNTSIVDSFKHNYDSKAAKNNKAVALIDANDNVKSVGNYQDYMKDTLTTNIRSKNIADEGQRPVYVSSGIMVNYALSSKLSQENTPITIEQAVEKIIETPEHISQQSMEDMLRDIEAKAQRDLGIDFKNFNELDSLMSVGILTTEQRQQYNKLNTRVGSLTPQENTQLGDFIFNQVIPVLDNKGTISQAEVKDLVTSVVNSGLDKIQKSFLQEADRLENLIKTHANFETSSIPTIIASYKREAGRMQEIKSEDNLKALYHDATRRVINNLGIKESAIEGYKENTDNDFDEQTMEEREGWQTDVLSIDPNAKTSAALKRFYSSIPQLDKEGNTKKGVFGLPLYYSIDKVGRGVKDLLKDTVSDFDTMISKLETYKHPWIPQLIDKLKAAPNQTRMQFVSDMSGNSLKMGHAMLIFDKGTGTYKTKNWDALKTGITDQIHNQWENNFKVSPLILTDTDQEGNLQLNKEWATNKILNVYDRWVGSAVPVLAEVPTSLVNSLPFIKKDKPLVFSPVSGTSLYSELHTKLVGRSNRLKFNTNSTSTYQIRNLGDNKFEVKYFDGIGINLDSKEGRQEVTSWLSEFGINLSQGAINELFTKGLYHNYEQMSFDQLFNAGGLFRVLNNAIKFAVNKEGIYSYDDFGKIPVREGVVKSLASLEYQYNTDKIANGIYTGGKNIYPITQEKFATRRALDLTTEQSPIREQLSQISFSKNSLWLELLNSNSKFRQLFEVSHIPPGNALQIMGSKAIRDNSLNKLSSLDYEVTGLTFLTDRTQGEIDQPYPGTDIPMRMATLIMPTMSDKTTPLRIKTAILDLSTKELNGGKGITDKVKQVLYQQVVKPELERIIGHTHRNGNTNIKGYDEGARMFLFIPELNNIEYVPGLNLQEALTSKTLGYRLDLEKIENNTELMDKIYSTIDSTINAIKEEKKQVWERDGILSYNNAKELIKINFVDDSYLSKSGNLTGTLAEKADMMGLDTAINQMLGLSNSFMLFGGDPALYYKKDSSTGTTNYRKIAEDTFVNVGKRLANQIAPAIKLGESEKEQYLQVFLNDRKSIADKAFIQYSTEILDGKAISDENYDFIKEYLGKSKAILTTKDITRYNTIKAAFPNTAGFFEIEGSDAQEYTTWQEHLNVLEKLGKTPDIVTDITLNDIAEARKLFSSGRIKSELTEREKALIGLVMQPMKPKYTGQIYDEAQDVMRTVYIKSSSFPLIPQVTEGLEIDHLRESLEGLQDNKKMFVRASYQTANKVGALKNAVDLWDTDGRAKIDNLTLDNITASSLTLNRRDFGIQQDVPFKTAKATQDKVTMGTQLMKLLFGNDIIKYVGEDLYNEYNDAHVKMVELQKSKLFEDFGLDKNGTPVDYEASMNKIQGILQKEGEDRGMAAQVLDSLALQGKGGNTEFSLPLWASINSNKFESLLNSIVVNRVSRIKFPGNSYVAGSPEGFKTKMRPEGSLSSQQKSQVVYTSAWDGDSLKASANVDGKVKKVQVLVASKFRDNNGNLINLLDNTWSEIGDDGIRRLKADKIDPSLMSITSFRIPTTGISSASQVEIVGFLPYTGGDLMILPSNLTKQKGLDFDIDKENAYQYWHYLTTEGKIEKLSDTHRVEYLAGKTGSENENADKLVDAIFGDAFPDYDYETKLLQNKIIGIYEQVLNHPDPKVQAKINTVLSTDYAEREANFIDRLRPNINENWTPLSGEYQKQKMFLGSSGKIGTGAYAIDVTFHSLLQQARSTGEPMAIREITGSGKDTTILNKSWRFGVIGKGGIESDGILGRIQTLDGSRSTSDLLNEVAQTAVDNEKLQIMGKVNINDLTLDVHKVFNLLGIDKFDTANQHSISYLFMSQPILRDYVERLANSRSNLAEFEAGKKDKIVTALLNQYDINFATTELNTAYHTDISNQMSETNMVAAIKSTDKTEFGRMQAGVLLRFLEMEKYGLAMRGIQTTLNVDSKGLGKSFFDVVTKREKIDKLGDGTLITDNGMVVGDITNIDRLIGTYIPVPESSIEIKELQDKGYYLMGNNMIKPTNYTGAFNVVTTNTAYNTWKDTLPYDADVLQTLYSEILPIIQGDGFQNEVRTIESKQDILGELKKYLTTSKQAGFLGEQDNINEERSRLYIDSKDNTSLASYLNDLMKVNNNVIVDNFIKSNKLLNSLEFQLSKDGTPSLIKFNNTKGEIWDEQYMYEALSNLLELRGKQGILQLPKIGNKEYTLDTLAQDIINYAMLGNAKQEAIQFTKYVPVQYMEQSGYSYMMRNIHKQLNGKSSDEAKTALATNLGITRKTADTQHYVSEFTTQYIQHNPSMVKYTIDAKSFNQTLLKQGNENSYLLNLSDKPIFLKVYDKFLKGNNKFRLFKFNGESYNEIAVLGTFGMDEYQMGQTIGHSIINNDFKADTLSPAITNKPNVYNLYSIGDNSIDQVVSSIANDPTSPFNALAKALSEQVSGKNNKTQLNDTIQLGGKPYTNFNGSWNPQTRVITINPKILSNHELVAQTVLHELVHELTFDKVNPFISIGKDGYTTVLPNAPQYVGDLVTMFNTAKNSISSDTLKAFDYNSATNAEKSRYYGYTNIHEFMTMALTDRGFQEELNKIPFQGKQSILDKFKEMVKNILQSLGVQFNENFTAAHAINSIFEVIQQKSNKSNPYQEMFDEANNILPVQFSIVAGAYPEIRFDIKDTEC